jgi:hypothetical protein
LDNVEAYKGGKTIERERVRQYFRKGKKKGNTSSFPCTQASLCVSMETKMRKNGKWDLGFWEGMNVNE